LPGVSSDPDVELPKPLARMRKQIPPS
jgi:hypothetical protein